MSIYIWDKEIKDLCIWDTPVKEAYLWDTKVRPTIQPLWDTITVSWTETSDTSQFNPVWSDWAAWVTAWDTRFDQRFGYSGVRLSTAWVETAEITQKGSWWDWNLDITRLWTLTSGNNVMIKFPVRWIKMTKSWSTVTLSMTKELNKSWYQYYAFTRWSTIKNKLYIWTYLMSNWCVSLSWKEPQCNTNRYNFYDNILTTYNSNGYTMLWLYQRWYIAALYMMKYGNPDSRTVVGRWYVSWSAVKNTGATNSITSSTYWTSSTSDQMKLFWLEDWWWNAINYIAYCMWDINKNLVVDKTNTVHSNTVADYTTILWWAGWGWWISSIIGTNDWMFTPTAVNWSSTTYYKERIYANSSRVVCAWANYNQAGWVFTLDYTTTMNYYPENWTRIMFL